MKPPLDIVREACIKANPEIMELKFGCRVEFNRGHGKEYGTYLSYLEGFCDVIHPDDYQYGIYQVTNPKLKILGRPITLADVLLAIDKTILIKGAEDTEGRTSEFFVNQKGDFCEYGYGNKHFFRWNLLLPLDQQSPETITFLAELFTNK